MIFDTHSHCYFEVLLAEIDAVHERALTANIDRVVQIGCDVASSLAAITLARKYPQWYATVGYHPVDAQDPSVAKNRAGGKLISEDMTVVETPTIDEDSSEARTEKEWELRALIDAHRDIVVAVGETGLDQYHLSTDPETRTLELARQHYWFERLAVMGRDYDLPLVIHSRNARAETIDAIKKYSIKHAVIHCFSENFEFANELMVWSPDIYFSFSGILTYKNALEIQDAAARIPLDRILVETDAPYLSPAPDRSAVNEPAKTALTLEKFISLRSESREEVIHTVYENSMRFYAINR